MLAVPWLSFGNIRKSVRSWTGHFSELITKQPDSLKESFTDDIAHKANEHNCNFPQVNNPFLKPLFQSLERNVNGLLSQKKKIIS